MLHTRAMACFFPIMFPRQKNRHYQAGLLTTIEEKIMLVNVHTGFSVPCFVYAPGSKQRQTGKINEGKMYFNK